MKIKQLDTSLEVNQAIIEDLQLRLFPSDTLFPIENAKWWVVLDDDKPVGFAGLVLDYRWLDCGYLCRAGVLSSYRGQGIQKRLLRVREAYARRQGWKWLITNTYHNYASANSLISQGYKLYEPTHKLWAKGTLHWRKKL